ncbi:helicase RepA family protein [Christensenellaceae bacterium OttesenSCG-928-K19]|nr:helicase RepA family protein [Christensenellaceae bacterium OttesenSCG-928-K19]
MVAMDMALHIASGETFWGLATRKTGVLYLALEDNPRRIHSRLKKLLGGNAPPDNLYFETKSGAIDTGLDKQIRGFVQEHPDVRYVVVDILNRILPDKSPPNQNAYEKDSKNFAQLKRLVDELEIGMLLVHHTNKTKDKSDKFNNMSGSNGIIGAADLGLIIDREVRDTPDATLHIISREMEDRQLSILFDNTTCKWRYMGTQEEAKEREESAIYYNDPIVKTVKSKLEECPGGFEITAQDFSKMMAEFGEASVMANVIGKRLRGYKALFAALDNIKYTEPSSTKIKIHTFEHLGADTVATTDSVDTADTTDTDDKNAQ